MALRTAADLRSRAEQRASMAAVFAALLCLGIPACTSDSEGTPEVAEARGDLSSRQTFLVVYRALSVPHEAAREIAQAGGTLVASFAEIGVAVAHSHARGFASALGKVPSVQIVAPTTGTGVSSLTGALAQEGAGPRRAQRPPSPRPEREPLASMQWNMNQIHAAEPRGITPGKKSVVVGVLDSGIDDGVADLTGQVDAQRSVTCMGGVADTRRASWSYDAIGHGTHVAGIIGAKENGKGTVGIAPGVTLAAVKLTEDGLIYPEAFVCGLYWAATHGFDLVNASLFTDPWYFHCSHDPIQSAITTAEQRAVSFAMQRGVTVIAATSNEQLDLAHANADPFSPTDGAPTGRAVDDDCKLLPVELTGVIGVSAVDAQNRLAYYSNYGLGVVDLAAPGGDAHVATSGNASGQIVSAVPAYSYYYQAASGWQGRIGVGCSDGLDANDPRADPASCRETYALLQGTSQATPHVTGVAALALSHFGKLSTEQLLGKLKRGATPIACPTNAYQPYPDEMPEETCEGTLDDNGFYGAGMVDALATLRD